MKWLEDAGGRKFIGFVLVLVALVLIGRWMKFDAKELVAGILGAYTVFAAGNIVTKKIINGGKKK